MATLVLTAVGTMVGGPLGGAIGALVGQQVDAALFAPKARQGPRLGELAVQTSSYGSAIPRIFGIMRVAGTVIWATEIKERRSNGGGGKGRPKLVEYSYSASFAVALSERRVADVRRIWADGKLLRGAARDFKSQTGFRLHHGDEDQAADPLIASVEGIGQTPAYRGIAYAVFEGFELADYGNRIPSLTFEVVADAEPVSVGAIADALTGGQVADGGTPALVGYAAGGDSIRSAVAELSETMVLPVGEAEGRLRIGGAGGDVVALDDAAMAEPPELLRKGSDAMPGEVSIAYHDRGRDYQTGLQRAAIGLGLRSERIALAAVLDAGEAKGLAEQRLAAVQAARVTARLKLGPRHVGLRPGARVRIGGQAGVWRIERWTLEDMSVRLELVRIAGGAMPVQVASEGRVLGAPDLVAGATRLMLFDLPLAEDVQAGAPRLLAVAAGEGAGWRSAALSLSLDDGASWTEVGSTAAPAVIGVARTMCPAGDSALLDLDGSVEVELAHTDMWLQSCADDALARGANLAVLGRELIQFGSVQHVGARRFRLSRLLRGRRGTEWASGEHVAGEAFVLLERDSLAAIEVPVSAIGVEARVRAYGRGDDPDGVEAQVMVEGVALRPPSPVHLRAERRPNGDVAIEWVRRSRAGWDWLDGGDAPVVEDREGYVLTVRGGGSEQSFALDAPGFVYSLAAQAADGVSGVLDIEVAQVGRGGLSRPATIRLN